MGLTRIGFVEFMGVESMVCWLFVDVVGDA
jgi:hypothetical protein